MPLQRLGFRREFLYPALVTLITALTPRALLRYTTPHKILTYLTDTWALFFLIISITILVCGVLQLLALRRFARTIARDIG